MSSISGYQISSSIKGCLPIMVIFHQSYFSMKGCIPSKDYSIEGLLPSIRLSSIKGSLPYCCLLECSRMSPYCSLLSKPLYKLIVTGRKKQNKNGTLACALQKKQGLSTYESESSQRSKDALDQITAFIKCTYSNIPATSRD